MAVRAAGHTGPMAGGATTRVVIVDDDDISRAGTVSLLAAAADLVVEDLTPAEALARPDWHDVDVALVDATDRRNDVDHFVGVRVVEAIRATRASSETTIIVVTGYSWLGALRVRMREARADLFFDRMEVQERATLLAVVRDPDAYRDHTVPEPVDTEAVFRLGVVRATEVNEGLRAADDIGVDDRPPGRSRARDRDKRTFALRSGLTARNRDGTDPDRNQETPSWPQISAFVDWARRVPPELRRPPRR